MAESVRCKLEVVAAPTFSLSTPNLLKAGVIGDTVTFVVAVSAVGSFTDGVVLELTGAPEGAVVTYSPENATATPGNAVTISIDTTGCSAGTTTMTVQEAA